MIELTQQKLLDEFKPIFYPHSIAIVGASPDPMKIGYIWTKSFVDAGFTGTIYPVNPRGGEMLGLKIYSRLTEIPGPVDHVIVVIPRESVPTLLDDCAAKKVKAVHFFTAGFSEMGDATGNKLEEELREKARQGGFHIIGPNCIGTYCPESNFPYGPGGVVSKSGTVSFISQSGGIGVKLVELGMIRGINYSKGISFGNGIDLDSVDFMRYMAADPKTSIIGAYLEGTRNGRRLFDAMRETARIKPLIVWKAGRTEAGAAAARSHTGSLASVAATWSAAFNQTGAIEVSNLEELTDTLLTFQQIGQLKGNSTAIVGGLADGGGGISVSAGDACAGLGLDIPSLSTETTRKLASLLGQVGSILHNPVDVSQAGGRPAIIEEAFRLILADPSVNLLIVQEDMGILVGRLPWNAIESINDALIAFKTKQDKPIAVVLTHGASIKERRETERKLSQASIPVFPTMERAAKAIMNFSRYYHSNVAKSE